MRYNSIVPGRFLSRPNRFIAEVELQGEKHLVHVKNTGRCRELLVEGARVYLEDCLSPKRKTRYDLIAVEKGDLLINMDSQAPNQVFREYAQSGEFVENLSLLKGEQRFGNSRFDFYYEYYLDGILRKGYVEVKGVTLEEDGVACFPDAPTLRGVKHIGELIEAQKQGFETGICFIIQMAGMRYLCPNDVTHPAFGDALRQAEKAGVKVFALSCLVEPDLLQVQGEIPLYLGNTL